MSVNAGLETANRNLLNLCAGTGEHFKAALLGDLAQWRMTKDKNNLGLAACALDEDAFARLARC